MEKRAKKIKETTNEHEYFVKLESKYEKRKKVRRLACLKSSDPWSPLAPPKAGKLLIF